METIHYQNFNVQNAMAFLQGLLCQNLKGKGRAFQNIGILEF